MRVLHVTPAFMPAIRYGGPIFTVLRLCQAVKAQGVEVDVVTSNAHGDEDLDVPTGVVQEIEGLPVRYFARLGRSDFAPSPGMLAFLVSHAREYDLVHVTSTFSFASAAGGFAARRAGRPYVVSPRGSLQQWSLSQKRWKKLPYWHLVERRNLSEASALHATAELEARDIVRAVAGARTFVVPNGADLVDPPPVERVPTRIVFLGRIHKKKGFDVLVPALSRVAAKMPEVETVVAGPDDDGEWARVEQRLQEASPRPNVRYVGVVEGKEKMKLLASSAVFVLPSHSENFGQAVVEALAAGTPAVVSRNCPWEGLETFGAGAWVENTPGAVAEALLSILRDPGRARRMGDAARRLAATYDWSAIGKAMVGQYERIVKEWRRG